MNSLKNNSFTPSPSSSPPSISVLLLGFGSSVTPDFLVQLRNSWNNKETVEEGRADLVVHTPSGQEPTGDHLRLAKAASPCGKLLPAGVNIHTHSAQGSKYPRSN